MSYAICFNLVQRKILSSGNGLTLYRTTEILDRFKLQAFAKEMSNSNDNLCWEG